MHLFCLCFSLSFSFALLLAWGALALALGCDCQHGPEPITPTGQVGVKNEENVGTLWRSAYQLGVSMLFTARREPPHLARP